MVFCHFATISLLLYATLSPFFIKCQAAVITVPPVSVTVPIDTTTNFTCKGTGSLLNWLVQSGELNESIKQERKITVNTTTHAANNFSSVLTVKALPINDNLTVGCEIITFNPFHRVISNSDLFIRGISPVDNLIYSFSPNNSLIISWSPPLYYSNDISPINSSYSYQLLVNNEKGNIIINFINTTKTNIEVYNITECDTFIISVTAMVTHYTSIANTEMNNGSYNVDISQIPQLIIIFWLSSKPSQDCEKKLFVKDNVDNSILIDEIHIYNKSIMLQLRKFYQLSIYIKNLRNDVKDIKHINISTFNVQNLILTYQGNRSVSVQCVFASGSTTDECFVMFTDNGTQRITTINISGSNIKTISLTSGNYTVTGYDISNRSIFGPAVYYPKLITVTSLSSTSEIGTSNIISMSSVTPDPTTTLETTMSTTTSRENSTTGIGDCVMTVIILIFVAVLIM